MAVLASKVIFLRCAATAGPFFPFGKESYALASSGLGSSKGVAVKAWATGAVVSLEALKAGAGDPMTIAAIAAQATSAFPMQ